jgi:8-amino-7-oxononanoate synthase
MPSLPALPERLLELAERGLLREPDDRLEREGLRERFGADFLDLTSNDYLGLAAVHVSRETLLSEPGAGASRLIHGTRREHLKLEEELADWTGQPRALLFTSAYAANVGALGCLLGPEDWVVSDALNHASLIDGCRLSRARVRVVPHLDLEAVEAALAEGAGAPARWVVVESYYSMDGDSPDLAALRAVCDRHSAHLYVDEAHGLGVFGPQGAGLCRARGVHADVLVGGLGKACGAQGGFVAGSEPVRRWLWNRARSFVFSTGTSPLLAALAREQVQRVRSADTEREALNDTARTFRQALEREGLPLVSGSHGPILSVVLGSPATALGAAQALREQGILAQAIRPPTVPEGASRLRLTLNAHHRQEHAHRVATALRRALHTLAPAGH